MMLSLDTAYRSFGGEVEASSTPTICRLSDSRRHQLWAIAPVNVAYVEKLCELMSFHGASRGLLFCSPGLSGNASGLASRQRIKSYTLESVNSWIEEILK